MSQAFPQQGRRTDNSLLFIPIWSSPAAEGACSDHAPRTAAPVASSATVGSLEACGGATLGGTGFQPVAILQPNLDLPGATSGCQGDRTYPVRLLLRAGPRRLRAPGAQNRVWEIPCDRTPVGGRFSPERFTAEGPTRSMKNGPKPGIADGG
jgi:hypothetical protein